VSVPGIQLADLVSHTCSVVLLGRLGMNTKIIRDPSSDGGIEEWPLDFELWARLRWTILSRPITDRTLEDEAAAGLVDSSCALYVAPELDEHLAFIVNQRFRHTWLGCIH
jgi:hypothetical protein